MRVSAVITTFNQAAFVGEALDGVLGQTYPLHQIILIDDGSRDDAQARVAPYRDRIRYIRQANHGVAGARNAGVAAADGDLHRLPRRRRRVDAAQDRAPGGGGGGASGGGAPRDGRRPVRGRGVTR